MGKEVKNDEIGRYTYIKPMLDAIRYWQENDKGGLEEDVKAIDDAITFIAASMMPRVYLLKKNHCRLSRL